MLEVRTATYGPGIDKSQHAKSFSHKIRMNIYFFDQSERATSDIHLLGLY